MNYVQPHSAFPSQVVPDREKDSIEYGLKVANAIESEWKSGARGRNRFNANQSSYHELRLYARGEQSPQKYKDELAINGDLSYLNLSWDIVPIAPKFVDIVVNGMATKMYKINAFAQDPESLDKRLTFGKGMMQDLENKDMAEMIEQTLGINVRKNPIDKIPDTKEELDLYMQLDYKLPIEIAEEELIDTIFSRNKYDLIKRRVLMDLTVLGIGASKTSWNRAEGIRTEYVDPANLVYSYTEDPNFQDLYYVGEVKNVSIPELFKQFPHLSDKDKLQIQTFQGNTVSGAGYGTNDTVEVIYFEYKTYKEQVYKIKKTKNGLQKAILKTDEFQPDENDNFERVSRTIEVLYRGAKVVGTGQLLEWGMAEHMTRPDANVTKVNFSYNICAPRMYRGKIDSVVKRIKGFCDMIQITHLKLQQVISRTVPDGVFIDADGLAEVDLGNGTNYNPAEALNMFFQTGSIVGRSLTSEGELNRGKIPVQEINSSSGEGKIRSLITTYNYYLQMIRDTTGLNEARDGSTPDSNALVGLQKLAAANSNVATRHILQSCLYITLCTAENIALLVGNTLQFPLTKEALITSISAYNVTVLDELLEMPSHNFGIFLELEPDEEEQAKLEENIKIALQSGSIDLEDAIDIREIRNIKLANQMIKVKRKRKEEREDAKQAEIIRQQGESNAVTAERAAMAEVQKNQALTAQKAELVQLEATLDEKKMQLEATLKERLMEREFQFNMQLKGAEIQNKKSIEQDKEDRKDERTRIQATQQSKMIEQRNGTQGAQNFESAGFDTMSGFGLEQFDPK